MKVIITAGGTGGHVFPGCNLANHLKKKNFDIKLVTDRRGSKYLKKTDNLNFLILPSSPLIFKNIFLLVFSSLHIFYSIFISLIYLIIKRPNLIFGMGGYASLPICLAASILRIKFVIYENNLVIGKANKFLLPFAKNILVAQKNLEGIPKKFNSKIFEIGNIIKKEIINFSNKTNRNFNDKLNILVLGGSQAAKSFAEILPKIFSDCSNYGIKIKLYQHCLSHQNEELKLFYEKNNIEFEFFNFKKNLIDFFSKVDLAITRSGSSMLAELTNVNIPFISVPLPSSADNHQLKNAIFYQNKKYAFLIEEKDLNNKLFNLIKEISENRSILDRMVKIQSQYSDKNVYQNVEQILEKITHEKN